MFLLNFVLKNSFERSLKWRNAKLFPNENKQAIDIKLTAEEQNTLRYVAGFIPFSLEKRYMNQQESEVGKMVFIFIRRIENVATSILNWNLLLDYNGQDLRDVLMEKLKINSQGIEVILVKNVPGQYSFHVQKITPSLLTFSSDFQCTI